MIQWAVAHKAHLSLSILQARTVEWVAMLSSTGSSQPRDRSQVSRIAGKFLTVWATRETLIYIHGASQVTLVVKNLCSNRGDLRDSGSLSGLGRSPGGRNGNSLQYSCLENLMNRRAWWATVHRVSKSCTWQKWLSMHAYTYHLTYNRSMRANSICLK